MSTSTSTIAAMQTPPRKVTAETQELEIVSASKTCRRQRKAKKKAWADATSDGNTSGSTNDNGKKEETSQVTEQLNEMTERIHLLEQWLAGKIMDKACQTEFEERLWALTITDPDVDKGIETIHNFKERNGFNSSGFGFKTFAANGNIIPADPEDNDFPIQLIFYRKLDKPDPV